MKILLPFLFTITIFSSNNLFAETTDFEKKVKEQVDLLERELGVGDKALKPIQVPLTSPAKRESSLEGRGPTMPLPAETLGQETPAFPNLTTLSGTVEFAEIQNDKDFSTLWNKQSHLEISFYNHVSPSGIPHSSSREIVPPLILQSGVTRFSIKVPKGGGGFLVAYIYYAEQGRSDIAFFSEEIIGIHPGKIDVPNEGVKDVKIVMSRLKTLRAKQPFVTLSGWIHDEYHANLGIAHSTVSIVGTTIVAVTDRFGRYLFPQLPKFSKIILQIERAGYVTTRMPIVLTNEDQVVDIFLSPNSKYARTIVPSIPNWESRKYGLIEGKIIGEKKGLIVRISQDADGIIYLDRAGLPTSDITKDDWEHGIFEEGSSEAGDFLVVNVKPGLAWVEVWDGSKRVLKEPLFIEQGIAHRFLVDLNPITGFTAKVINSDFSPASNVVVRSLSHEGEVEIQPVGFIQKNPGSKAGIWIETKNSGEFIFPDFEYGSGLILFETKKENYFSTWFSAKPGTRPTLIIFPKDYMTDLIGTANLQIKKINRTQFSKLPYFPEILPGTGIIVGDVKAIPPKTVIECFGNQGTIAYIGEKGLIDIYSTSTTPEGDGRFLLYNLVPGEYTIAGYDEDSLALLDTVIVEVGVVTFMSREEL